MVKKELEVKLADVADALASAAISTPANLE